MDGPNKRKRRRTSYLPRQDDTRSRSPSITSSIESSLDASESESQQLVETTAQTSLPQSLQTAIEESPVPKGRSPGTPSPSVTDALGDADSRCQITLSLEGGMLEVLRSDAVNIMTSVLVNAAKIRIQAGKFGFEQINIGTTTNTAEIRKYTEQSLVELPFKVATEKIAKTGAGYTGIGLQKSWEEAFYWDIIQRYAATLNYMPTARRPHDGFTAQERSQQLGSLRW